jgi:hypothetical protein
MLGYRQFTKRIEQIEHKLSNLEKKTAPAFKDDSQYQIGPGSGSSYKNYSQSFSKTQAMTQTLERFEKPSQSHAAVVLSAPKTQPSIPNIEIQEKKINVDYTEIRETKELNVVREVETGANISDIETENDGAERERRERRERMERIERLIAREQAVTSGSTQSDAGQGTGGSPPATAPVSNMTNLTTTISPEKVPGPFRSLVESAR